MKDILRIKATNKFYLRPIIFIALLLITSVNSYAQQLQTLRGKIVDEISRVPLPGANVILVGSSPIIGATTDIFGEFKINVPIGRNTIKVMLLGYEQKVQSDIVIIAGKEMVLTIGLTEKVNQMNEVVVSYDRSKDQKVTNNEMVTVSGRSFNIEDTKRYAGSFGDPSRMAANFAGVNAGNDSRNDIVVRGNSPQGTLWQLEGLNIPNPNHFGGAFSTGGPVSMLNNNVLDKSDFLSGAFPAQYGNALSAVFDLKLRSGNNEKREYVAQVGINGFELGAEGPFNKKGGASYLINYRYSTLGLMQSIGVDPGTGDATPLYQDVTFNFVFPKFLKGKLSVYGIAGISSIDLLGKDVDTTETNFYGQIDQNLYPRYQSGIFGTSYERSFNKKTFLKVSFGANIASNNYSIDSIDLVSESQSIYRIRQGEFTDNRYTSHIQLTNKINSENNIVSGVNLNFIQAEYFNKDVINGTTDRIFVDTKGQGFLGNLYSQWKHRFTERMSANIGFNIQYFTTNNEDQTVIEPRLGWKYSITNNSSIRFGYGIHHQNQTMYTYNVQTPIGDQIAYTNRKLEFTQAQHFVVGYEQTISNTIQFKVEGYYQDITSAPVTINPSSYSGLNQGADFAPSDEDSLVNQGTGNNIGVELTLEKSFSNNYYFLVTGSIYDSKYKGSDGVERNTAFNTKYAGNILVGKDFKLGKKNKTLSINFRATSTGGRYLTPLNFEASALKGDAVKDDTKAFSFRQDPYFRMDFKIGYKKEYKASTLEVAVDVQNFTDNQNVFDQGYNRKTNTISTEYQQGLNIIPSVKFNF